MKKILFALLLIFPLAMPAASAAADESRITGIQIGASRNDIHNSIGAPDTLSLNGFKECFSLKNGKTAVLIYNKWGYLDYGYIVG